MGAKPAWLVFVTKRLKAIQDGCYTDGRVVIESPYAGDVKRNRAYLKACLRDSLARGEFPFASHAVFFYRLFKLLKFTRNAVFCPFGGPVGVDQFQDSGNVCIESVHALSPFAVVFLPMPSPDQFRRHVAAVVQKHRGEIPPKLLCCVSLVRFQRDFDSDRGE